MKTADKKDLQTKSVEEVRKLIKEASEKLVQLRLDHHQAKLQNTRSIFNTRKELAVLKTVLKIKEEKNG